MAEELSADLEKWRQITEQHQGRLFLYEAFIEGLEIGRAESENVRAVLQRLYREFDRFDIYDERMTVQLKCTAKETTTIREIREALK